MNTPVECSSCGDAPVDCVCHVCQFCGRDTRDYEPAPSDVKIVPTDRLCEECHASVVRVAKWQRREDEREAHGDWLRDQQRGAR